MLFVCIGRPLILCSWFTAHRSGCQTIIIKRDCILCSSLSLHFLSPVYSSSYPDSPRRGVFCFACLAQKLIGFEVISPGSSIRNHLWWLDELIWIPRSSINGQCYWAPLAMNSGAPSILRSESTRKSTAYGVLPTCNFCIFFYIPCLHPICSALMTANEIFAMKHNCECVSTDYYLNLSISTVLTENITHIFRHVSI